MKHTFKSILTLSVVLFFNLQTIFSQSQPHSSVYPGIISGSVVDENAAAIPYASVYVMKATDSLAVQMSIADAEGKFIVKDIPYGNYFIEIQYMGYSKHRSTPFELSETHPIFRMSKFKLFNKSTALQTVEVKAQKDMLQSNLDKRVFNVESSIIADGATAVEVLQDIPSVDVDLDGNVTLRGSENVTVLVDGRPSNLTLDQIPASQIESIEVITNPSARLEPDGMAGIVNVILKKKKESGFNGLISLGGSMTFFQNMLFFDNYNANLNLNYSYNKINVFFNYNYRSWAHHSAGSLDRYSWFETDSTHLLQENEQNMGGGSHNLRGGIDWYINKQNTLSFSLGYDNNKFKSNSYTYSNNSDYINLTDIPYQTYDQNGLDQSVGNNISASIFYKKVFNTKGRELTTDVYFSQMNKISSNEYVQQFSVPDSTPDYYQETNTNELSRDGALQIDFVTPVGNGGRIETGYKFSYRSVGQDYSLFDGHDEDSLLQDFTQSNNFLFSEYINAAYFIYSNTFWKKFKVQLGVRGELANTSSDLKSADTVYYNNYLNLFPTIHLRYDINDKHSLQISYSRRVSRPSISQLNPFIDISDKLNLRTGNPNLTPEFVNSFELGYLAIIKKSSINITAFYRQRNDIISRYTQLLEGETDGESYTYTLTSYQNLDKSQNFGFEVVYGQQLWKFWKINLNGNFYRVIIDSDSLIDENLSRDWAWGFRLNQTFSLAKDWDLQLNFRYRSPSITTGSMGWGSGGVGQGQRSGSYSLNFGVKKSFFSKNLVVSLNIRDLLYNRYTKVHTYSFDEESGYDAWSIREHDSFQVTLSLTYKINNYKKRQETQHNVDDEIED
jgi:outer membrane receptor protein involved in Fe transport